MWKNILKLFVISAFLGIMLFAFNACPKSDYTPELGKGQIAESPPPKSQEETKETTSPTDVTGDELSEEDILGDE